MFYCLFFELVGFGCEVWAFFIIKPLCNIVCIKTSFSTNSLEWRIFGFVTLLRKGFIGLCVGLCGFITGFALLVGLRVAGMCIIGESNGLGTVGELRIT